LFVSQKGLLHLPLGPTLFVQTWLITIFQVISIFCCPSPIFEMIKNTFT
jgi:hypothetical protein